MKRKICLVLAAIMSVSLCACSGKGEASKGTSAPGASSLETAEEEKTTAASGSETPSQPAAAAGGENLPSGPVEIQLWTDFTIDDNILIHAVDGFNEAYKEKGYTVVLDKFAGSERSAKMAAAIEANQLPALFFSAWFTTSDFVHQGYVADISDIAAAVKEDMFPSAYEATQIDKKSYMIGLYQSYFGMMYNGDMFREAGLESYIPKDENALAYWSLDEFDEILTKLKDYFGGTEGYPMGLFAASSQADTFMLDWLCMYGGNMWSDGKSSAGSDENVVKALDTMIQWMKDGKVNSNVATKDGTEVAPDFKNGLSAICSAQISSYNSTIRSMEAGEFPECDLRMAAVPVKDGGKDTSLMANYIYGASILENGKEDEMAVARLFLTWLLEDKESLTAINTNAFPCFSGIAEDPAVVADHPMYPAYTEAAPFIWDFTGNVPGYVSTRSKLFPQLQAAFSGSKTAAQALEDYSKDANEVIEEYTQNSLVLN